MWSYIHLGIHYGHVIRDFQQLEVDADGVSLVKECADLIFEYSAPIHPVQVEGAEHLPGYAAIQSFGHLVEQFRGGLLGEGCVCWRRAVLRVCG